MKIVVCIRQGRNGEINPFDACAYEEALKIKDAEIILLSMGVPSTEGFLQNLTRLGATKAILLTDKAFAGADTLATAYTLSLAINILKPQLVFCGRQTLEGDTAQTGPMLAEMLGFNLISNCLSIKCDTDSICCKTRLESKITANFPALLTIERTNQLRLPSIRSKISTVEVWDSIKIDADISQCGLAGSPTRVIETKSNDYDKRKCTFIDASQLKTVITQNLNKNTKIIEPIIKNKKLKKVVIIGEAPRAYAESISDDICVLPITDADSIAEYINLEKPNVVLWGSDIFAKNTAAKVAAKLKLGLCADCTALETDGEILYMIRPALSGSIMAKIKSITSPSLATVRTSYRFTKDIAIAIGYGAKNSINKIKELANSLDAEIYASRKAVDNGLLQYDIQVGLTGKTVNPSVYIAVGISGAVHHIVGMKQSGTVIAINPDKNASIFEYADYGILCSIEDLPL